MRIMRLGLIVLIVTVFCSCAMLLVSFWLHGASTTSGVPDRALIAIVFDDAHHSFPSAVEKMARRNMKGTVYVPTGLIGAYDFHVGWVEVVRAHQLGWEIGSHTVTHPDLKTIDDGELQREILGSLKHLDERGMRAASFAAPYGESTPDIQAFVMKHFSTNRMAWGETVITPGNLDARALPVFDLSHAGTDFRSMDAILERAIASSGLAIVVFHKLALKSESPSGKVETIDKFTVVEDDFDAFLKRVSELEGAGRIRTVTVSEGVSEIERRGSILGVMSEKVRSLF